MPVTLNEAKNNAQTDLDVSVIDEFRKSSDVLDRMTFDDSVSPTGGGAIVYGYRRLVTQADAAFRAINAEYTPAEVTTQLINVELKPIGGSFEVDRVVARIGAAASSAVSLNLSQKIKASRAKFHDAFVNGDTAVDANGFDGLSKLLTGTATEYLPLSNGVTLGYVDWTGTAMDTQVEALDAMVHIDNWLSLMDGDPDVIYGNRKTLALFKRIAAFVRQLDDTTDAFGRPVTRYNGIPLINLGAKAGSNTDIIPLVSRDADGGGAGGSITNLGDLYAVRFGLDGVHGAAMAGDTQLVRTWLPDFTAAGAVKKGEVEMGPVAPIVRASKSAAVFRNIKSA